MSIDHSSDQQAQDALKTALERYHNELELRRSAFAQVRRCHGVIAILIAAAIGLGGAAVAGWAFAADQHEDLVRAQRHIDDLHASIGKAEDDYRRLAYGLRRAIWGDQ